jgi:hypothetical protein
VPNQPATIHPVTDNDGAHLWLHPTCGETQWYPTRPDYCAVCFLYTERWEQMHTRGQG